MKGWWIRSLTMVICPRNSVCQRYTKHGRVLAPLLFSIFFDVRAINWHSPYSDVDGSIQGLLHCRCSSLHASTATYSTFVDCKPGRQFKRDLLFAGNCALLAWCTLNKRFRDCLTGFLMLPSAPRTHSQFEEHWGDVPGCRPPEPYRSSHPSRKRRTQGCR